MVKELEKRLKKSLDELNELAAATTSARQRAKQAKVKEKIIYFQEGDELTTENLKKSFTKKSVQEIISTGTIKEKAFLYISDHELNTYFGAQSELTREDIEALKDSLETREHKRKFLAYLKKYDALKMFGRNVALEYKRFQIEASELAMLVNQWADYERTARGIQQAYSHFSTASFWWGEERKDEKSVYEERQLEEIRERFFSMDKDWDGATLVFKYDEQKFVVDIDGEGNLYSRIQEQAERTEYYLSRFKAIDEVLQEWDKEDGFSTYLPLSIQITIDNAQEERYLYHIARDKKYLRSNLNYRLAMGETITDEDRKRAVFPDYYEIVADDDIRGASKDALRSIMERYE